jgi:uncharacterized protein (DUF1697 family)
MMYAALLRGVNVGTAKRVPMAGLRALVEGLGGADVRTLLNSGNVVFTHARTSTRTLAASIRGALASHLRVDVPVIALDAAELDAIVAGNPLAGSAADPSRLLAAIPARPEHLALLAPLTRESWGREKLAVGPRAAYLWCPDGVAASRLWKAVNQALGGGVTSRNWDTVLKLRALV